jgi:hypothetical protein
LYPPMRPYRDDLVALRTRLDLLELAVRDRSCEGCAARRALRMRRPVLRVVLACTLGLSALAIVVLCLVAASETSHAANFMVNPKTLQ